MAHVDPKGKRGIGLVSLNKHLNMGQKNKTKHGSAL
jgi:hypothetical protein